MEINLDTILLEASVLLVDGITFEGVVAQETSYGVYLHIGGDSNRLSLFPWHTVSRVIYKSV